MVPPYYSYMAVSNIIETAFRQIEVHEGRSNEYIHRDTVTLCCWSRRRVDSPSSPHVLEVFLQQLLLLNGSHIDSVGTDGSCRVT